MLDMNGRSQIENAANGVFARFCVAGAEGIEPSARGFGVENIHLIILS